MSRFTPDGSEANRLGSRRPSPALQWVLCSRHARHGSIPRIVAFKLCGDQGQEAKDSQQVKQLVSSQHLKSFRYR
jgi:hypothetical protein